MARIELLVNGKQVAVEAPEDMPVLWVLRDLLGLTGTKYSCGQAACGTCTILVDGQAVRACVTPAASLVGRSIATIEGTSDLVTRLVDAWVAEEVPQCGFCQPGQVMSAAALLLRTPEPTDEDIDHSMRGNLCRCGTYQRIRRAIKRVAAEPAHER
jgi:isoquinoline 1-oxidoreductase alpha subunit